jgi:DNA-binding MarR family transcriptional regulator
MKQGRRKALAQPELEVADRLHSAAIHLLRRVRVRDLASGIGPAQLSALSVLVFGGPRSLGELAAAEQVKPPTMSRIVAGLERAGLVRRQSTDDRRRMQLQPTPKGTRILQAGRRRRVQSVALALRSLDRAQLRRLSDAINILEELIHKL